jgi:hypothetical protein
MKRTILAAAIGVITSVGAADALPVAQLPATAAGDIIAVAGGCGPGRHRGPYGGCLRNYDNPASHACPRGYHIGPGGRCRGNGR